MVNPHSEGIALHAGCATVADVGEEFMSEPVSDFLSGLPSDDCENGKREQEQDV